jgi:nucleoside-diphosphate-sugar epimerase
MRIAVTGATGFIGRHVVRRLVSQGHEVIAIGRTGASLPAGALFVENDLLKSEDRSWIRQHRVTHLLHLAWYAEHGSFWNSPLNIDWSYATVKLVRDFCMSGGERVVIAGSCAEYDWTHGYCREGITPTDPSTLYGKAKDSARRMVETVCAEKSVPVAWGRIFIPFGAGEDKRRIIPSIVRALTGRIDPFPIGLDQWRDFSPVENVAEAFVVLLAGRSVGAVNICSGTPVRLQQVVTCAAEVLEKNPGPLLAIGRADPDAPRLLVGDNSALARMGWMPPIDLWQGMRCYVEELTRMKAT